MSSRGTLEHIVEGTFRALLICSAVYFGAKYAPYVLKIADNVKSKIFSKNVDSYTAVQIPNEQKELPEALQFSDPKLYNSILIDRYVSSTNKKNERKNNSTYNK